MGNLDVDMAAVALAQALPPGFIAVPATTLPGGVEVPAFAVARWLAACGPDGQVVLSEALPPWVRIGYHAARLACALAGFELLTEREALAIAHDIAGQAVNWTGGAVGDGRLFQGLHLGRRHGPQAACMASPDPLERRWFVLSNGERIIDAAGNAFSWVFDDVQGNAEGIVARTFLTGSPTLATAPGAPMQQGMGWWPRAGRSWWGRALARGGSWSSQEGAGIFTVVDERPQAERAYIGFRCTLPLGWGM
ncbi:hypothetical protein [Massilia sp. Root1485]|uniref:hypothetical protein n=1 Tax=Massilia sp. Root1485 TaxID=1736472 RepID=UPI0006FAA0F5|nr:hypothetical protein [Massilia sp. Root1485]KQZ52468.1 hypothetical protein ASD92_18245 [Massilia sp. Root1485]